MVLLEENVLWFGEEKIPIKRLDVWFRGPTGLIPRLNLAVETFKLLYGSEPEVLFNMVFKPVPVAIGENGQFEEM